MGMDRVKIYIKKALKEALISYEETVVLFSHEAAFYEEWQIG